MATTLEETFTTTRITRFIPKPFSQVIAKLESSIKRSREPGLALLNHVSSKQAYEDATNTHLGPHGFMHFAQIDHGAWLPLYGVHTDKKVVRVIFGNPQIAITMIKHDIAAALFAPVEALIVEREDGRGTDVVQVKPSTLIVGSADGENSKALKDAAERLDDKLEKLWEFVGGDE